MKDFESLRYIAEQEGFESAVTTTIEQAPTVLGQTNDRFSICVAALQTGNDDGQTIPFNSPGQKSIFDSNVNTLVQAANRLTSDGLLFLYGSPAQLSRYAVALAGNLTFRYWIAVRTLTANKPGGLRPEHRGLLLLSTPTATINRIRIPHARCRHCDQTLKDWGGKSHLMHPEGAALSDVWMDVVVNGRDRLPAEVLERALRLSKNEGRQRLLLLFEEPQPFGRPHDDMAAARIRPFNPFSWQKAKPAGHTSRNVPGELLNRLHHSPCLEVLKAIPSETIDLAFADPPFNLTKRYQGYGDDRAEADYIGWCKRWLLEYVRVLKPGGTLFLLNLPRWSVWLADFLMRAGDLHLQNWIVWSSLPEPKGVLMPAHYALLYFTKGPRAARFNYCSMEDGWQPFDEAVFPPDRADVCKRRQCVRKRRASSQTWRGELTDIWYDIPRDRRSGPKNLRRGIHPCETPEALIDRVIRLSTNPGDIVLDAFSGTGTSAVVAQRLGRRFIAVEQAESYVRAAQCRMEPRDYAAGLSRSRKSSVSKRALQIELQRLALSLGRLPTRAEAEELAIYEMQLFDSSFPSWRVALKAARVALDSAGLALSAPDSLAAQIELFESRRPSRVVNRTAPGNDPEGAAGRKQPDFAYAASGAEIEAET